MVWPFPPFFLATNEVLIGPAVPEQPRVDTWAPGHGQMGAWNRGQAGLGKMGWGKGRVESEKALKSALESWRPASQAKVLIGPGGET